MAAPSPQERLARLAKARDGARDLLGRSPARWENECEGLFKEFRLACVHLRKDREVLDSLEDKESAWRFICKFCRERPFHHDRCNEVLRILMLSDRWMETFIEDPEVDIKDLPASIVDEFSKRVEELEPSRPRPAADPASRPPLRSTNPWASRDDIGPPPLPPPPDGLGPLPMMPTGLAVVVQRCVRARVLTDEQGREWGEIGRGLVVSVSFAQKATEDRVRAAARFLLSAKLSTADRWEPGQPPQKPGAYGADAESVVDLCSRGEEQGILIIPQASLVASVGGANLGLSYGSSCAKETADRLYAVFAQALRATAGELILGPAQAHSGVVPRGVRMPAVVAGTFHGRQFMEMTSAGPFMHSFNF